MKVSFIMSVKTLTGRGKLEKRDRKNNSLRIKLQFSHTLARLSFRLILYTQVAGVNVFPCSPPGMGGEGLLLGIFYCLNN